MTPGSASGPVRTSRHVEQLMGMPVSLALRGRHAGTPEGYAAWARVVTELRWVDLVFSTYRRDSAVSRLDRGETTLADCPSEVAEVLALAERAEAISDGAFSIRLPAPDGRLRLDPSGVVKGWAVQRAARWLGGLADTGYALGAGGDLVCRARPGDPDWRVGIEDPHDAARVLAVVPVRDGAVATSGTAHRGAHLVDGRTGRPPQGLSAVTVVGPSLTWADIDATAAYAHGAGAEAWLATRRDARTAQTPFGYALVLPERGDARLVA